MNGTQEESLRALLLEVAKKHGDIDRMYPLSLQVDGISLLAMVLGALWADGWPVEKAALHLHEVLGIGNKDITVASAIAEYYLEENK